jgi:radical SAM protein with 4Fe4S-binding SPASM domain
LEFNQAVNDLKSQYNVTGPIDVSLFFEIGGEGWLKELLQEHYQEAYEDNYRLVLYFDKDEHLYHDQPGTLVTALQKHITEIDISHFFVILMSTDSSTATDLELSRTIYSTDSIPINHILVDTVNCKFQVKEKKTASSLCVLPWMHLFIGTSGDIIPCCESMYSMPIGNIKDDTIANIMNSEKFKTIRKNMLEGRHSIECSRCYDAEDNGVESERDRQNKKWQADIELINETANRDGSVDNFLPKTVHIRFDNTCNFKCRMCTGYSSSRLEAEEKKTKIHGEVTYQTLTLQQRNDNMSEVYSMLESVELIDFAGGESLIIPTYNKILQRLKKLNKTDVKLQYSSNLSVLSKQTLAHWRDFPDILLSASLDSDGKHAEYNRSGTVWEKIEENYSVLVNEYPHVVIRVHSAVSIYNVFKVMEFQYRWITSRKISASNMKMNLVRDPDYLSIQVLPLNYKKTLSSRIDKHVAFLDAHNCERLISQWREIQYFLMYKDNSFKLERFFDYTDALDTHRNENFESMHAEYKDLRQYI